MPPISGAVDRRRIADLIGSLSCGNREPVLHSQAVKRHAS